MVIVRVGRADGFVVTANVGTQKVGCLFARMVQQIPEADDEVGMVCPTCLWQGSALKGRNEGAHFFAAVRHTAGGIHVRTPRASKPFDMHIPPA